MMTNIEGTPVVEANGAIPKWKSQVDPQNAPLDDMTSLNFSVLSLWGSILGVQAALGYAVKEGLLKQFPIVETINAIPYPAAKIAAWATLAVIGVVVVLLAGLATFAAYLYFVAASRVPATGEPSKFLKFNNAELERKWAGKPIPVEVRPLACNHVPCACISGSFPSRSGSETHFICESITIYGAATLCCIDSAKETPFCRSSASRTSLVLSVCLCFSCISFMMAILPVSSILAWFRIPCSSPRFHAQRLLESHCCSLATPDVRRRCTRRTLRTSWSSAATF